MSNDLTPQVVRERATAAHQPISAVMARAGIPDSTFWRWEKGAVVKPHPVTVRKISDALDQIEAERRA